MSGRRVRQVGRPVYGRFQPNTRSWRSRPRPQFGVVPRRLVLLAVAVGVLAWLLRTVFAISTIEVKSPARAGEIKAETEKALAQEWWQGNLLTLNNEALEEALVRIDPMIKTVEVRRRWPQGVRLNVALKEPSLGWSTGNQSYLLDREGSVIGSLPQGSTVPVVVDGSNLPVEPGKRAANARFVAFTTELAVGLGGMGLIPTRYEVRDTTLDLYVTTNKGYRLIFDTGRPATDGLADLRALAAFMGKQGQAPAEYIDLRIAGKAYYK